MGSSRYGINMIGWIVKTTQNDKATPTPIFGKDFAIG
jgi:hypothetical protein